MCLSALCLSSFGRTEVNFQKSLQLFYDLSAPKVIEHITSLLLFQ